MTLLEEVCHWGWEVCHWGYTLRFPKPMPWPAFLSLPMDQDVVLSYCPSAYPYAAMPPVMMIMG